MSRRAHESISRIPLDYPNEVDSDDPRLGVASSEGVVHRPLFPYFWTKDHFDKSVGDYSFAEGDLTLSGKRLKSSLEDFITSFKLELVSDPQHPEGPLKRAPRIVGTVLILQARDVMCGLGMCTKSFTK